MREAIYARVSTDKQTTAQQLSRLRPLAPGAGEFVDEASSGRTADRPAFNHLCAEIRAGRVSTVYAVKIDRLGRSVRGILDFFELADQAHVQVVLADQSLDTSTPMGKLLRTVLAGVAELEGDLIRERTRAAMNDFKIGVRTPKGPIGRPRRILPHHVEEIVRLRETVKPDGQRLKWREVALRVHLPEGTCKNVYSAYRHGTRTVENGPQELRDPEVEPKVVPSVDPPSP